MTVEIIQSGTTTNDEIVSGNPAVRIRADYVRFTNGEAGRILSTQGDTPAISIEAAGAILVNSAGGIIRGYNNDIAIRGSSGADAVENFGLISGQVSLGSGADSYVEHSAFGTPVTLGAGDDVFRFQSDEPGYFSQLVQGDGGTDRFVLAGVVSQAFGANVTGFEALEIGAGVTNVQNFSGFGRITMAAGGYVNLVESLNPAVDMVVPAGSGLLVGFGSSLHGAVGTDAAESIEIGSGAVVGSRISLGGGDDQFTYYVPGAAPTLTGGVDGGAGEDILRISVADGRTVDLAAFTGFEYLDTGSFTSDASNVRLTHVSGFAHVEGDVDASAKLTLADTYAPTTSVSVSGPGKLVLEASATIGSFDLRTPLVVADLARVRQGDDRLSLQLVNAGRVVSDVKLYLGDDIYDGSSGSVGGTIYGFAGNDRLTGGAGADRIDGGFGVDRLVGGGGADTLIGGGGNDLFVGTRAELAGDTIADLSSGDRISVSEGSYADFTFARVGTGLTLGAGQALTLAGNPAIRLVTAVAAGGTDLLAVNRYSGISDFDGNGHSDILWRRAGDGLFTTWQTSGNVSGDQFAANASMVGGVPTDWQIVETFDWDGDGRSDMLWRNQTTGGLTIWTGKDGGWVPNAYQGGVPTGWQIAGTGDLNGDGKDDIVWREAGGAFSTWLSTGAGFDFNAYYDTGVPTAWQIVGLADFTGDGKDDLLWRNQQTGQFTEWASTGAGFTPNTYVDTVPLNWHVDALADFDGDGKDDLLWRRDDDGAFTLWQSTGTGFTPNTYYNSDVPTAWQVAMAGDFNDDGKADILWRNAQSGQFSTWQSNGGGFDANVALVGGIGSEWSIQAHDYHWG